MSLRKQIFYLLPLCFLVSIPNSVAQLQPSEPDPLTRIRDAAKNNVEACSATGETLCEQVAPKIVANTESSSLLESYMQRLDKPARHDTYSPEREYAAIQWALAAFRDAKVEVHTEKYPLHTDSSKPLEGEDVVAEIRGREKPDEWVLLGADLGSPVPSLGQAYNAALVIEAARDIQLTGIHPRRSIRFVLFGPGEKRFVLLRPGEERTDDSLHYVRAHRDELDRVSAAIIFTPAWNHVNGFILNGRHDIEAGVKKALDPIHSMELTNNTFDAPMETNNLFFLLEGIPNLLENCVVKPLLLKQGDSIDATVRPSIPEFKRNAAIAAVTAFDIAENAEPLGKRLSRPEIESLLENTGLDQQMKALGLWPDWESGQIGRQP